MERVDKWLSACDEETWLEEYNQVCFIHENMLLYGDTVFWLAGASSLIMKSEF